MVKIRRDKVALSDQKNTQRRILCSLLTSKVGKSSEINIWWENLAFALAGQYLMK